VGLTIALENERGDALEQLGDPQNILHRLLPGPDDRTFSCLRFIDWYADTTFNSLQMQDLLDELKRIGQRAGSPEESNLLDQIRGFARRVQKEPHYYLKFYGD